jgi:hypothetical protein
MAQLPRPLRWAIDLAFTAVCLWLIYDIALAIHDMPGMGL